MDALRVLRISRVRYMHCVPGMEDKMRHSIDSKRLGRNGKTRQKRVLRNPQGCQFAFADRLPGVLMLLRTCFQSEQVLTWDIQAKKSIGRMMYSPELNLDWPRLPYKARTCRQYSYQLSSGDRMLLVRLKGPYSTDNNCKRGLKKDQKAFLRPDSTQVLGFLRL